ncbi:MAG: ABC transporter, ATP-binding protein [Candidatus Ozemobacter sibiricus]|jgi:ABC-2 type transport system ATP-binding protein|uniref:ABC transporter, ATP-binding protein n=1 Tax=Candidatus Ozemobacter sibiricus TaxID=2268124 RepID=A0A367ZQ17_9BACT|nr:MAG: ABC transporter, ATP-binding protein [Candidatus Ozemobacter sibiricus]
MRLEVRHLRRYYGTTRALDDVSFAIEAGQIVGFVGPNGAGKTTTMRILATLDEPTSGDALLDGISLLEHPERARAVIGYVPDSLPVHRDITIHEYLDFFARAYGIGRLRRESLIQSLEEFTNLTGIREKMLGELSKGMKQRVSLARALIHDPQILLMDEPAAGLDPRARIELRELVRVLAARGKGILISSHILTELAEICDAALIIEQGRLLRSGSLDEITAAEKAVGRAILIRVVERAPQLVEALLLMPGVQAARLVGDDVEVDVEGDERASAALLTEIVRRGFPVHEFRPRLSNLEAVFMNVTKGDVQ